MLYPSAMHIHASIQIIIYIVTLILLNFLSSTALLFSFALTLMLISLLDAKGFTHRCYKLRWLFLSVLSIYAFITPGEFVSFYGYEKFLPDITKEGILLGFKQMIRLVIALACLSVLLLHNTISTLVGGLHKLLFPLTYFNVNVTQFVVRLSLTLYYVDAIAVAQNRKMDFLQLLHDIDSVEHANNDMNSITLETAPLSNTDRAILAILGVAVAILVILL